MANCEVIKEYIYKSSKAVTTQLPSNVSVPELLASNLEKVDPETVALINGIANSILTYGELHLQAQAFASALVKLGVTADDFVMFYSENSFQCVIAMLGAVYLGLGFCPVPPASGPFEITEQISGANGTVLVFGTEKLETIMKVLSSDKYVDTMKRLKVVIELESRDDKPQQVLLEHEVMKDKKVHSFDQLLKMSPGNTLKSIPHFQIEDPKTKHFLICFTSGTTGKPKGAIHTHRSFMANFTGIDSRSSGEHLVMWFPLGHMSGTFLLNFGLYSGQSMILFPGSDLEPMLSAVQKYKVKNLTIPPNQATSLANTDYNLKYDLSSLRCISHGGSLISGGLISKIQQKYRVATLNGYGATEFLTCVDPHVSVPGSEYKARCIGQVRPGVEMKIVDLQSSKSLPPFEDGEICARGASCFVGYLNNEEATKSTIDSDGWYHSGDIGHFDTEGRLFYTDRIKEMIKYKLYSVIPAEIEDFLHRHEAVAEVCVVGVPHTTDGNLVRAYVQLIEGGKSVTEQELIDYVRDNMGTQKRLRAGVRFVPKIPCTVIGKVDRQYFKRLVKDELISEQVD